MKKTFILSVLIIGCSILLPGCSTVRDSVPATEIHGFIGGKPFSFVGPKDLTLGSLTVTAATNGTVSMAIVDLQAKTNPDIITTTGDAQAKITAAQGDALTKAFEAGGKFAGATAAAIPK